MLSMTKIYPDTDPLGIWDLTTELFVYTNNEQSDYFNFFVSERKICMW